MGNRLTFFAVVLVAVPSFCEEEANIDQALEEAFSSSESQESVMSGLQWIADHQLADGSWSFDLSQCPKCQGRCSKSGRLGSARITPTALALWAMSRGHQTPERGDHRQCVANGLKFLFNQAQREGTRWGFVEESPPFDSHAMVTILLWEALNTGCWELDDMKPTVERTVAYAASIQNPDGGWGRPKSDVVSTAWYTLASIRYWSGIRLPDANQKRLVRYINSLQVGHKDGDTKHDRVLAAGLFCQVPMGIATKASVRKAIDLLAAQGHATDDMIYNLFAGETLILDGTNRLYQDKRWRRWNVNLRDFLVSQQVSEGHERGSWDPAQSRPEGLAGGRLYSTAMATLILETYGVSRWCNCGRGAHLPENESDFPE